MWDGPHAENQHWRDKKRAQWARSGGAGGRLSCAVCRVCDRAEGIPTELAGPKSRSVKNLCVCVNEREKWDRECPDALFFNHEEDYVLCI